MVVTSQHLATRVGVDILKQGGNAVDAAVAVGYALGVVFPGAGSLGGGGFMTLQLADGRKTFIDFREKAPLAATADMYLDRDGNVVRGLSTKGYLAAGVPGNVAGFELALARYGTMKRAAVIAPAIRLAQRGFVLEQGDADMLAVATEDFRADAPSAAIFLDQGEPFKAGQRLVQKDLARTLRRIAYNGADGFYKGPIADAIVAASTRGNGIITKADLDAIQGARACADRVRLSRLSHRVGAAAQLRRRDRLRNSGHSRRLPAARTGLPLRAGRALPDRGDAPRVRGSQQLSRRSRFRAQPDRAPAGQGLRRDRSAPRSTRPGRAFPAPSSPASRRTKGPTPRTTRSSTRPATPWR